MTRNRRTSRRSLTAERAVKVRRLSIASASVSPHNRSAVERVGNARAWLHCHPRHRRPIKLFTPGGADLPLWIVTIAHFDPDGRGKDVRRSLIAGTAVAIMLGAAAPSLAQTSLLSTIQRIRAEYPTPMSSGQKGELLNRTAWQHRDQGWGLLRKDSGNRCASPQGVDVACDILVHAPTAWHFDVLIDSDFAAEPGWTDKGPCLITVSGCEMSRFLPPIGVDAPPPAGLGDRPVPGEYNGDGIIDVGVYRMTTGEWLISMPGGTLAVKWGAPSMGDVPVPADYDGDRRTDIAVYRKSTGQWLILNSSNGTSATIQHGSATAALQDVPLGGDFDRDGRADLGIYRLATGEWFIRRSSDGGLTYAQWGDASLGDVPVPGEYDGDGQIDAAVYRSTTGEWFVTSRGSSWRIQWGAPTMGDIPVPSDYDGDRRTDLAVYRASTGQWFILNSSNATVTQLLFGSASAAGLNDAPMSGDYDRDGRADLGIYRVSSGDWFIRRSSDGAVVHIQWGAP